MRSRPDTPMSTRRALGACRAAGTASISLGHRAIAAPVAPVLDPGMRCPARPGPGPDIVAIPWGRGSQPLRFGYTDLSDQRMRRTVLPLASVNPPRGVKLLAWCLKTSGHRQFIVRAMRKLTAQDGDFAAKRMALLQGLVAKEGV